MFEQVTSTKQSPYRYLFKNMTATVVSQASKARSRLEAAAHAITQRVLNSLHRHHGPEGILSQTWPTGSMVLWIAILLGGFLLLDTLA